MILAPARNADQISACIGENLCWVVAIDAARLEAKLADHSFLPAALPLRQLEDEAACVVRCDAVKRRSAVVKCAGGLACIGQAAHWHEPVGAIGLLAEIIEWYARPVRAIAVGNELERGAIEIGRAHV